MTLLDFSEFIEDEQSSFTECSFGERIEGKRLGDYTVETEHLPPRNPGLFFGLRGFCPFCREIIPMIYDTPRSYLVNVWSCVKCGWWEVRLEETEYYDTPHDSMTTEILRHAIVRKFSADAIDLPISVLTAELAKHPDTLYDIHPRKMEEMVKHVFESFFNCDVKHCGQSHDQGIDLILVQSNSPVLVQVKRRQRPGFVEPVSCIREFLGAIFLQGQKNAIYVTTASHFSSASKASARTALEKKLVNRLDLVDMTRFLEMLAVAKTTDQEPWRKHIDL